MVEKKQDKGLMEQIEEKFSEKSKEEVEVPEKALDKLECNSDGSDSGSESGNDSDSVQVIIFLLYDASDAMANHSLWLFPLI